MERHMVISWDENGNPEAQKEFGNYDDAKEYANEWANRRDIDYAVYKFVSGH